jgi:hypothetical protein
MSVQEKSNGFDVLSSNVFNLNEDIEKIEWRNLSNEKRIKIINTYFVEEFNNLNSTKKIDTNTISTIIELLLKGKMKSKKEITYDKVNERIIQINALIIEQYTDIYIYKPSVLIKKEKSKKIAKNVLFRKKT